MRRLPGRNDYRTCPGMSYCPKGATTQRTKADTCIVHKSSGQNSLRGSVRRRDYDYYRDHRGSKTGNARLISTS